VYRLTYNDAVSDSRIEPSDLSGVHLWLIFMKSYRALREVDARSISVSSLGFSDFAVLEMLLHKGPLPVNTIGRKIMLTSGSITTAIDRLEKKRFVRRQACPDDRRVTFVQLTPAGRKLIEKVFKVHAAHLEKAFEPLSEPERAVLGTLLKKVGKHSETLLNREY
jgi:MarR family transcriptional regulator, 2-MHQ and catechol-resistance regulon repressor